MSAVRATSAATVRTAVARTAVARGAVARGAALAALAVLAGCVTGIPGALGPGPALTGALLPATGVFGVLHAVRPR